MIDIADVGSDSFLISSEILPNEMDLWDYWGSYVGETRLFDEQMKLFSIFFWPKFWPNGDVLFGVFPVSFMFFLLDSARFRCDFGFIHWDSDLRLLCKCVTRLRSH